MTTDACTDPHQSDPMGGSRIIYKICPVAMWHAAEQAGVFTGAPVDVADGFIHFSTAEQVAETAAKHFAGQADLVLVAVAADALGPALRYEPSRGGALFPHLYAPLPLGADGIPVIPALPPAVAPHVAPTLAPEHAR